MQHVTVPRETWDAMRGALKQIEWSNDSKWQADCARQTLTAANAVNEPKVKLIPTAQEIGTPVQPQAQADLSLTNEGDMLAKQPEILAQYSGFNGHRQWASVGAWLYEGDAIAVISDHFRGVTKMMQPLGWYCVSRDGLATQCADQRDAEMTAKSGNRDWPNSAPYRAVQLCEFEAHPQATEPAANWATYPEKCPITRRDFFMVIEHPELGMAPTYGGPYDSYTIPHMGGKPDQQMHDRELMCHRFDHDLGYWVDDEIIPLRVIHDDFLPEDDSSKASEPVVKDSLTVPAGYKLVPVNATPEMIAAAEQVEDLYRRGTPDTWGSVYRAMLAAAPEAKQ